MLGKALTFIAVCVLFIGTIPTAVGQIPESREHRASTLEAISKEDYTIVSQTPADIRDLDLRLEKDATLRELLSFAKEKGDGRPGDPTIFRYAGGHSISVAKVSDSLYLMTTDSAFAGHALLILTEYNSIRFFDRGGSLELASNGTRVEVSPAEIGNSGTGIGVSPWRPPSWWPRNPRFWECVKEHLEASVGGSWLHWYFEFICITLCLDPLITSGGTTAITCMPCIGAFGGALAACMQHCWDNGLAPNIDTPGEPSANLENGKLDLITDLGPQPFNPTAQITFRLAQNENVDFRVFNILGQEVAVLMNGYVRAGVHRVTFDGSNRPSGMYICVLKTPSAVDSKKLLLVK